MKWLSPGSTRIWLFSFQIEFLAVKGDGTTGFVAIDDVRFNQLDTTCAFTPEIAMPTTTTTIPTTIVTEPPMG